MLTAKSAVTYQVCPRLHGVNSPLERDFQISKHHLFNSGRKLEYGIGDRFGTKPSCVALHQNHTIVCTDIPNIKPKFHYPKNQL